MLMFLFFLPSFFIFIFIFFRVVAMSIRSYIMCISFHISLFAFPLHQPFPTCINIVHLSHRSLIYIDRPVQYLITPDINRE